MLYRYKVIMFTISLKLMLRVSFLHAKLNKIVLVFVERKEPSQSFGNDWRLFSSFFFGFHFVRLWVDTHALSLAHISSTIVAILMPVTEDAFR
jgi:hypothetical protein